MRAGYPTALAAARPYITATVPLLPNVTSRPTLRRDLGLLDAVGIGFGAIIGAGIFVVTGIAAGLAGPAFLVGLALAACAAAANALSSAQLAASYPQAGGAYEYGCRVLHPLAGFAAGWLFLASKISAAGTVALGLGGYLEALVPGLAPKSVAVTAIVLFTILSYFGIRRSSRANLAIVAVSVGALILFVVAGAGAFDADRLRPFAPVGWRGILESAALLFFAYTGYARIATLAEEVRDPERTIPRAIVLTIGGAAALYVAVALVAAGTLDADAMSATSAPLYAAAQAFPHSWAAPVVAVGGITAMLGVILSQILGLSRMVFAMARRGDLPPPLAHVHPRHDVPDRAVLLIGAVTAIVAATGTLQGVASAASFTILVYYGIANCAALLMPASGKLYSDAVPAFGLLACTVLALSLSPHVIAIGLVVLMVGFVARAMVRGITQG
ncbi:MAG TPA: amino acid permease [Vicinamibacterales bacterium]|nr:amino acid permease [Vicinamibacterales bacterium]